MLTIDEVRELVSSRGWLSQTSDDFRSAILGRVSLQAFSPGASIYSVDDPPGGMYGLVAGSVKIAIAPGEDGPFIGHIMTPGSWSGYGPAIAGGARIVGLTAGRNCQVLFLPLRAINEILARDPASWRFLAGLALIDTKIALGAMNDLMIRDEFRRFLAALLRAGDFRHGGGHDDGHDDELVWLDLNQSELAHMSNLSRTTAGVFLRRLEAEGHVRIGYGRIGLCAPEALRALFRRGA
jgi:CRP-like cAMP-binding protein